MANNIIQKEYTFDQFVIETQASLPADYNNKYRQSSKNGTLDFTGTDSFKQASGYLQHGWPEGVKQLKTALDNLSHATAPTLEQFFDVTGEELDISLYITEEPECMIDYRLVNSDGIKFVEIYVCYGYNWTWSTEEVITRGATILSNIDSLESNGYRCKIIGYQSACWEKRRKKTGLQVQILLKDFDENLELDRMAFCLVNPSMYRRMGFKLDELHQPSLTCNNYGHNLPFQVPEGAIRIGRESFKPCEINNIFKEGLQKN
jgi:hypothetical protein